MKKVECPSCGGTGVILRYLSRWHNSTANLCPRCKGFGFILIDPAVFPKFKPIKVSRNTLANCRYFSIDEYREFIGLSKVRNIDYVIVGSLPVPYSTFYKEHRNHR